MTERSYIDRLVERLWEAQTGESSAGDKRLMAEAAQALADRLALPVGPLVVRLGDLKMVLSSAQDPISGELRIGFSPSDLPLDTEQKLQSHIVDPIMFLQFKDEVATRVLYERLHKMMQYQRAPQWIHVAASIVTDGDGLAP